MKQFKKLYLLILLCVISFTSTNAKNIFYPVYINHVEHYKDNVLVEDYITTGKWNISINTNKYTISVFSIDYIKGPVKEYLANKRAKTLATIGAAFSLAGSVLNIAGAVMTSSSIDRYLYMINSFKYLNDTQYALNKYIDYNWCMKNSTIFTVTCQIKNNTDTLINGSVIIKPNELYEISYGCNYNSWRFSDGEGNVYCITSFHGFDVKKGIISQAMKVAFIEPNKNEKKTHKNQVRRLDLCTYESKWVDTNDAEYLEVKKNYDWDDGYQLSKYDDEY